MIESILSLFGVIVGAATTLLVVRYSSEKTHKHAIERWELEVRTKTNEERVRKTEELYVESQYFFNRLQAIDLPHRAAIVGKISIDEANRVIGKMNFDRGDRFQIEMLIQFYRPDLSAAFKAISDCQDRLSEIFRQFKEQCGSGHSIGTCLTQAHDDAVRELLGAINQYNDMLVNFDAAIARS